MSLPPLLSAKDLCKSFGTRELFSGITLAVAEGEKLALIGPNGSGKSTLLRMLAGLEDPDSGNVRTRGALRCAYVAQEDRFPEGFSVEKLLEDAAVEAGQNRHECAGLVARLCGRVGFDDVSKKVDELSGGWRKRLSIACALAKDPDLLLLDEPTNHLDIEGVLWLERLLKEASFAFVFVSHDRYFIERLASRVVEVNRQYPKGFLSVDGGYLDFLEARALYLESLQQARDSLANKVRREVEWLRQGAKARTTKSKYRSEQAGVLSEELKKFKLEEKRSSIEFASSSRKTKDLIKFEHVAKSLGGKELFSDVTFTLSPGVRLGVVGANGSGKTTFIKTLLGELKPDSGRVLIANKLKAAFFDQARKQLNPEATLKSSLCKEGDSVIFKGKPMHVAGWAAKFLFTRDQLELPVARLSGGEQARLLLAQLMLQETEVLFFDEPTNDLDIRTLEVLEESFCEYPGAIVLVTHDRYLLDRTTTNILALGGNAPGFYADYLQWENARLTQKKYSASPSASTSSAAPKFTNTERRELEGLEKKIAKAEKELAHMQSECASELVSSNAELLQQYCEKLASQQLALENLYARWEQLEMLKLETLKD